MDDLRLTDEVLEAAGLALEEALGIIEPIVLGPTWLRNEDGSWALPERTLGWQIAAWCAENLRMPDGTPWNFTDEQLRFVLWWYAVDKRGRFVYRTGVLQRMKGWGKDPLLAVICVVEFIGPCRFGGWDADGDPIGIECIASYVQISAVNLEQTKNTMDLVPSLMSDEIKKVHGVKDGAELIRASRGRKIQAVTSNYRAIEGKRTTFSLLNETHHWVSGNKGHKMYETIDGNATKMGSRYLAITNAYLPGEDSVAERMRLAWELLQEKLQRGDGTDIGFLYDSLEANEKAPLAGPLVPFIINAVRGDASWLSVEDIMQSIANTTIAPSRSRRMYYNQVFTDEESLHGPETWDVIRDDSLVLTPGDAIVLGFDGSKRRDATALVAIRIKDMATFLLGLWERPEGPEGDDWYVPRSKVNSLVHEVHRTYNVKGFYADVREWESYIADWSEAYANGYVVRSHLGQDGISWDMRGQIKRATQGHERLLASIFNKKLKHDGDRRFRRHVLNAKRDENVHGVYFTKETPSSPKKVDAYAALLLAHEALTDYRTHGKNKEATTGAGRVWFF